MVVWVVVADAARARIFEAPSRIGPLGEVRGLLHAASRIKEQGLVSDRPGRGRGRGSASSHTVGHEDTASKTEADRFARELAAALGAACKARRFERLHVLAAPRFLGLLRSHLDAPTRAKLVSERVADLTAESVESIRARLPERL